MNLLFAWRYFKAKKSTNAINIIAWVSVIAIVCITAAFILLLSVFNGFEGLVKSLYSSFYADLRIAPAEGRTMIFNTDQAGRLRQMENIAAYTMVVEEKALLQNGEVQTIVYLKGVDDQYAQVSAVKDKLVRGSFALGDGDHASLVLGSGVENALALQSDRNIYPLTAYLFRRGVNIDVINPLQAFAAENVATSGTFFIQQDIDNKYALTNTAFMKKMLSLQPDEFGSVEIAVKDPGKVRATQRELQRMLGSGYLVETRYEQNKSLYSVMNLEKWAIYGILTLMLIVAAFTMIGALSMLVMEKQKDIQVLKSLGADNGRIGKIFLGEGLLLAAMGSAAGITLALLLCWAQLNFKLVGIAGGSFLIDHYPVTVKGSDILLVFATVMLVALLASWVPARKAALQPVELRS